MKEKTSFRTYALAVAAALAVAVMVLLPCLRAGAIDFTIADKQGTLMGYINQGTSFSLHDSHHFDTMSGPNSMIFQFLLECRLKLNRDLRFFGSTLVNVDWAYPILSDSKEWYQKGFDKSRHRLYVFDDYRDLLKELHITWTPGDFYFRLGKQVVKWGETDGIRLMDQINPLDQRRGLADVEFETTVMPVTLLHAEYFLHPQTDWLTELALEFIFDPSLDFRGNEGIAPGNDVSGIWAPDVSVPLGGPYPMDYGHLGSFDVSMDSPGSWDSDAFRYGVRIKPVIWDAVITLNWFHGIDNQPVLKPVAAPPRMEISEFDGRPILHLAREGKYPTLHFVGFTIARDIPQLYLSFLGGVAPTFRTEFFYAFNSTFVSSRGQFEKHDELRYAVGIDWKAKVNFLNPRAYFFISTQFFERVVFDYPDDYDLSGVEDTTLAYTLLIKTSYIHNKLNPMFYWQRDITNIANLFKAQVVWEQDDHWNYTFGCLYMNGSVKGAGFQPFSHKDQLYMTIAYRY